MVLKRQRSLNNVKAVYMARGYSNCKYMCVEHWGTQINKTNNDSVAFHAKNYSMHAKKNFL